MERSSQLGAFAPNFSRRRQSGEVGEIVVLLVIVLGILAGGYWWLLSSKQKGEQKAREFARDTATRLAVNFDRKFLDVRLGDEARVKYPPSARERLLFHFRELGVPSRDVELEGTVTFTSQFFQPKGVFRGRFLYPTKTADLDLEVSSPHGYWQIDNLNLNWYPTPAAPGGPTPTASPAVAPTP